MNCTECSRELKPAFPDLPDGQPANALGVVLCGWYGGFFDCHNLDTMLCFMCADTLFKALPNVCKALNEHINREFDFPERV